MENFAFRIAKIVGTPTANSWSQVYTFIPQDEQKKKTRGTILGALSFFGGSEGVEAVNFGREILSRLHEEYYGELETPAMEKLSQAVTKVSQEFSKPASPTVGEGQNLEIVTGAVLGDILYLASFGSNKVLVKRENQIAKVLEGERDKVLTVSGFLKEGDFIVLGTATFFDLLPQGVLRAALENETPEEVAEILAPVVHGKEGASQVCVLIGRVCRSQEFETIEEVTPLEETLKREKRFEIKNLFSKLSLIFSKLPTFPLGEIYIRDQTQEVKRKKVIFTVALILIFLLAVSIVFGIGKRVMLEKEGRFLSLYSEAEKSLEEGEALLELNPAKGKDFIFKAKEKLEEIETLKTKPEKTKQLREKVEAALAKVVKEYKFAEVPTFFDLGLLVENGKGDKLSLYRNFLSVLDTKDNRLFGIDISRKSGEILAGRENISGLRSVASYGDYVYVLSEKGIVRVGVKNKKTEVVIEPSWREAKLLSAFAGNLYLLDSEGIWRYQAGEAGFSEKQKWFGEGVSLDLSEVVSMSIDGSIWLLPQDGKILKFSQGAPAAFGIAGLDKPFSQAKVIYTDPEEENLYILDKGNLRVVVLTKGGEYQGQYTWEGIANVSDMVVSEQIKKIFLLSENKIYQIDLK